MRYVAPLVPTLALVACATLPTFSAAVAVDAAEGGFAREDAGLPSDAAKYVHTGNYHVFVTSTASEPGQFGTPKGLLGANQFCQTAGASVNVNSQWVAFLHTLAGSARLQVQKPPTAFYNVTEQGVEEQLVFDDIQNDNVDRRAPINDEQGKPVGGDASNVTARVWIGIGSISEQCDQWTSSSNVHSGSIGIASGLDGTWEGRGQKVVLNCDTPARLYCFEQD